MAKKPSKYPIQESNTSMRLFELEEPFLEMEYTGYHHGQHDAEITATHHGAVIGRIEFSVYREIPKISYIHVEQQRIGLATKMVKFLQSKFPDQEIDFGMTTDDGNHLYQSLNFKIITNQDYQEEFQELDELISKNKHIVDVLSSHGVNIEDPDFSHLLPNIQTNLENLLIQYHDNDYDIEQLTADLETRNIKRTKKIII